MAFVSYNAINNIYACINFIFINFYIAQLGVSGSRTKYDELADTMESLSPYRAIKLGDIFFKS